jgi:SNF2 family DNA or RNA helicase
MGTAEKRFDPQIYRAVKYLNSVCDGANAQDNCGFNGFDSKFWKDIIYTKPVEQWSTAMYIAAYKMLRKYKRQLSNFGIDYDSINPPKFERYIRKGDRTDRILIFFDYSKQIVESLKSLGLSDLRFFKDGDLAFWHTEPSKRNVRLLRTFADFEKFDIHENVERLFVSIENGSYDPSASIAPAVAVASTTPAPPKLSRTIHFFDGLFVLESEYNAKLVDSIKNYFSSRKFEKTLGGFHNVWTVKSNIIHDYVDFQNWASDNGFTFSSEATEKISEILSARIELLEFSNKETSDFSVDGLKLNPYPFQNVGMEFLNRLNVGLIADQPGLGKAQPLTSKILTPSGWMTMKEMRVGQPIIGKDGEVYFVTNVFPQGNRMAYEITFNDGVAVECDEDHLWDVRDTNRRRRNGGWITKTLKNILSHGIENKTNEKRISSGRKPSLKWEIPVIDGAKFPEQMLLIPPYIMGMLLGDGYLCGKNVVISIPDTEIETVDRISALLPENLKLYENRHPNCPQYYITQTETTLPNPYKKELDRLGVRVKSKEKFIPILYLTASYDQRLELLRGLMDSDRSSSKNRITFHTSSDQLSHDVAELVRSLGGQAIIRKYDRSKENKSINWQISVRLNVCPFHLTRKVKQWSVAKRNGIARYIKSVKPIGVVPQQCISTSAPDQLYITDGFTVTHNTIQGVAVVHNKNLFPCVVLCPASIKIKWSREIEKWTNRTSFIVNSNPIRGFKENSGQLTPDVISRIKNGEFDFIIVNYELIFRHENISRIREFNPLAIILDEIHYLTNAKAKRTEAVQFLVSGKEPKRDERGNVVKNARGKTEYAQVHSGITNRYAMTGTPILNRPVELIPILRVLGCFEELFPAQIYESGWISSWEYYVRRYCNAKKVRVGRKMVWETKGSSNELELYNILCSSCMIRRKKSEVMKDLPQKQHNRIPVLLSNQPEYDKAEDNFLKWIREDYKLKDEELSNIKSLPVEERESEIYNLIENKVDKARRAEMLTKLNGLKQIAAKGKKDAAVEWIKNFLESEEKLVVFSIYRDTQKMLMDAFKELNVAHIFSSDDLATRDAQIQKFQTDPDCKLMFAALGTTAVSSPATQGIELHAASNVLFLEFGWNPALHEQAADRVHRIGQLAEAIFIWWMYAENSIDDFSLDMIESKQTTISAIIDGIGIEDDHSPEMVNGVISKIMNYNLFA